MLQYQSERKQSRCSVTTLRFLASVAISIRKKTKQMLCDYFVTLSKSCYINQKENKAVALWLLCDPELELVHHNMLCVHLSGSSLCKSLIYLIVSVCLLWEGRCFLTAWLCLEGSEEEMKSKICYILWMIHSMLKTAAMLMHKAMFVASSDKLHSVFHVMYVVSTWHPNRTICHRS